MFFSENGATEEDVTCIATSWDSYERHDSRLQQRRQSHGSCWANTWNINQNSSNACKTLQHLETVCRLQQHDITKHSSQSEATIKISFLSCTQVEGLGLSSSSLNGGLNEFYVQGAFFVDIYRMTKRLRECRVKYSKHLGFERNGSAGIHWKILHSTA